MINEQFNFYDVAEECQRSLKNPGVLAPDPADLTMDSVMIKSVLAKEITEATFCQQFWLLFKRQMYLSFKNPVTTYFFIALAFWNAAMYACLFFKLGQDKFSRTD